MTRISKTLITAAIVALMVVVAGAQRATPASVLLEAAKQKETVEGDPRGAIVIYKDVVSRFGKSDRPAAATALLRMAECYEKLGDPAATQAYQQILANYGDQATVATAARSRLNASEAKGQSGRHVWSMPTVDSSGGMSQDGRWLSSSDGSTGEVIVRDLQSGQERRASPKTSSSEPNGQPYRSLMSPDGSKLLVLWQTSAIAPGSSIRLIDLKAAGPVTVVYEGKEWIAPDAWSPDGRIVAFQLRRNNAWQIGVMSIPDGTQTVLKTTGWSPSSALFFSPDGRRLAYDAPVAQGSGNRDIHIIDVDGSREVAAVVHPSRDAVIGWAPDGTSLVFASDRSGRTALYSVALEHGTPASAAVLIKPDLGRLNVSFGVSRTGSLLYAIQTAATTIRIAEVDFETGKLISPIVEPIETFQWASTEPVWSPDGRSLGFVMEKPEARRVLAIRDSSTGAVRELSVPMESMVRTVWATADGIAISGVDLKGRNALYRADATTGAITVLSSRSVGPRFFLSPDGLTVYYRRRVQNGTASVFARDLRTDEDRALPVAPTFAPSPDGRSFAFIEVTPSAGTAVLKVVPAAGGDARVVQSFERGHGLLGMVRWTPDSRRLIYGRWVEKRETPTAFSVPAGGGSPVELDAAIPGHPSLVIHPDGRRVAFEGGGTAIEVWALENFLPAPKR
jgi:Tol biopolymer transport system component